MTKGEGSKSWRLCAWQEALHMDDADHVLGGDQLLILRRPNYSKARLELAKALGLVQVRKAGKKGARKKASTKRMTGHLDGRAGSALPTPTYVRTASAKPADGVTTALPVRSLPAPIVCLLLRGEAQDNSRSGAVIEMEVGLAIGGPRIGLQKTPMQLRWVCTKKPGEVYAATTIRCDTPPASTCTTTGIGLEPLTAREIAEMLSDTVRGGPPVLRVEKAARL
jgi:hypothetical protein